MKRLWINIGKGVGCRYCVSCVMIIRLMLVLRSVLVLRTRLLREAVNAEWWQITRTNLSSTSASSNLIAKFIANVLVTKSLRKWLLPHMILPLIRRTCSLRRSCMAMVFELLLARVHHMAMLVHEPLKCWVLRDWPKLRLTRHHQHVLLICERVIFRRWNHKFFRWSHLFDDCLVETGWGLCHLRSGRLWWSLHFFQILGVGSL